MFADRLQLLGTENAFKLADHIGRVQADGQTVVNNKYCLMVLLFHMFFLKATKVDL